MNDSVLNTVLRTCVSLSKKNDNIDIFDLMHDTSMSFVDIKSVLVSLIERGELVEVNARTYIFVGDINRVDRYSEQMLIADSQEDNNYSDRRAMLEQRRQELIARIEAELLEENDDDEATEDDEGSEDGEESEKIEVVDALCVPVLNRAVRDGKTSVSMIQRAFSIGYGRACRIMDWLEENSFVSSWCEAGFSAERRVLISEDDLRDICGDYD